MAYTNVLTSPANTSIVKAKSTRSRNVNNKALASNVATLTTSANHNFVSGESVGNNATCGTGQANIFIGNSTSKSGNLTNTIVIGNNASSTASQQIVIGSNTMIILNGYFGKGVTNTMPTSFTLNATGGSGTDIDGSTLLLAGGRGTGAGVGGSVILQTSSVGTTGSTLQTLVNRLTINNSGNVLVNGFTSSTVGLTVRGAASQTANLQEW